MTRFAARLAVGASAMALAATPAIAFAAPSSVDPTTGPVAFAFAGAFNTPEAAGVSVLRSPLTPGDNVQSDYVDTIPIGANGKARWSIFVNSPTASDPDRPAGVAAKGKYQVAAGLAADTSPQAMVATDYKLEDTTYGGLRGVATPTFVYLDTLRSAAQCASAKDVKADSQVAGLYVRQPNGQLTKVTVPAAGSAYSVTKVPMSAGEAVPNGADDSNVFGDIRVEKVTDVGDLVKTADWRVGDVNAASGWRVEVDNYVLNGTKKTDLGVSTVILGGVSCSVGKDFVGTPVTTTTQTPPPSTTTTTPGGTGGTTPATKPTLPVTIAAGDGSSRIGATGQDTQSNLVFPIVGAATAILAGGVALTVAKRRREARASVSE